MLLVQVPFVNDLNNQTGIRLFVPFRNTWIYLHVGLKALGVYRFNKFVRFEDFGRATT